MAIRRFDSYGGHDVRFVSVQKWQERGNQTLPNLAQASGGLSAPTTLEALHMEYTYRLTSLVELGWEGRVRFDSSVVHAVQLD